MNSFLQTLLDLQIYLIALLPTALLLLLVSQITAKAGYSHWHVLWLLVPFAGFYAIYQFLWNEWPIQAQLRRAKELTTAAEQIQRPTKVEDVTHVVGRCILSMLGVFTLVLVVIVLPLFVIEQIGSDLLSQFSPTIIILIGLMLFFVLKYFYNKGKALS